MYKLKIYYKDVKFIEMEEMTFLDYHEMIEASEIISKLYYVDYVIIDSGNLD